MEKKNRIFITGDTHGDYDIHKLNKKNFSEGQKLSKNDYLIICGDFGLCDKNNKNELWWLKWLDSQPYTTLFVDGNHENFDILNNYEIYPVISFLDGKAQKISDSVYHLMRGEIYLINNKKFFCFGGAFSHDVEYRIEHRSWWQDELPVKEEIDNALDNLEKYHNEIDYIITHDICDDDVKNLIPKILGISFKKNQDMSIYDSKYYNICRFFDYIKFNIIYKKWYNGHFHIDCEYGKRCFLYQNIIEII